MTVNIATSPAILRCRIQHYLESRLYGHNEVAQCIKNIRYIGKAAIFGGMLRDLSIGGNRYFCSDVDVVIETDDFKALKQFISQYQYRMNAYGGYRIYLKKWRMDIWPLSNTWAFQHYPFTEISFDTLLQTTFFNWDSVIYIISTQAIHCPTLYFDDLSAGFLDINFEPSPNIIGTLVRTLRMISWNQTNLSPKLAHYLSQHLADFDHVSIIKAEQKGYEKRFLSEPVIKKIKAALDHHQSETPEDIFKNIFSNRQVEMF